MANLIKEQVRISNCFNEALMIEDAAMDKLIYRMNDLFFDMIGVELDRSDFYYNSLNNFYIFIEGKMTLDELMRLANGQTK